MSRRFDEINYYTQLGSEIFDVSELCLRKWDELVVKAGGELWSTVLQLDTGVEEEAISVALRAFEWSP